MSLGARLYPGQISIYGNGNNGVSISGIIPPDNSFLVGIVDQVWFNSGQNNVNVGDSVWYKQNDVIGIFVSNWAYTVIPENKVILIETAAP